jgi:HK97 family phage major capsid protein
MKTNIVELTTLTQEASVLASKTRLTKEEQRRFHWLTGTAIPAVKAGATLADVTEHELNIVEARNGFRLTKIQRRNGRQYAKSLFMQKLADLPTRHDSRELRASNEAEGAVLAQLGTYSGLGYYVPTDFAGKVFATMAQHDPLYDEDSCTVINSTNAKPYPIPVYDDLSNEAVQVSEAQNLAQGTQVNLGNPGHVLLGSYSFRTPIHYMSMEVFQDAGDQAMGSAYDLFAQFAGDRLARAIGQKLVSGGGPAGTTITGIIPALQAAGVNGVVAAGSSGNDGSAATGANSIGSADIAALYFSVNAAYRASPKCSFMMADSTLAYLAKIVTKMGLPLVNFEDGVARIMGKPVKVSPSVPAIGSDAITVLFGDFSYWNTRLVSDDSSRIQVFKETRVEQGLVGLQYFLRADGILAFNSPNVANAPINYLIQHS